MPLRFCYEWPSNSPPIGGSFSGFRPRLASVKSNHLVLALTGSEALRSIALARWLQIRSTVSIWSYHCKFCGGLVVGFNPGFY